MELFTVLWCVFCMKIHEYSDLVGGKMMASMVEHWCSAMKIRDLIRSNGGKQNGGIINGDIMEIWW